MTGTTHHANLPGHCLHINVASRWYNSHMTITETRGLLRTLPPEQLSAQPCQVSTQLCDDGCLTLLPEMLPWNKCTLPCWHMNSDIWSIDPLCAAPVPDHKSVRARCQAP